MAKFSRNSIPDRIVWKQTGPVHDRSYWLAVPPGKANPGSLTIVHRNMQKFEISKAENVSTLLLRMDQRMVDLDKPITISFAGKEIFNGFAPRTIGTMLKTLSGRGDPKLMFDAEVSIDLPATK